jgi:hypothetical protein
LQFPCLLDIGNAEWHDNSVSAVSRTQGRLRCKVVASRTLPLYLDAVTSGIANCREDRSHGFENRTVISCGWVAVLVMDIMASLRPRFRVP